MKMLTFIFSILFSTLIYAQDSFVIKDVMLFDGEQVIKKTSVLVENGRIAKVARKIRGNYTVINGEGKFLMPALSNAHVHCWSPAQLEEAAQAGVLNVFDMAGMEPMQKFLVQVGNQKGNARFYRAGYAATAKDGHGTQFGFSVPTLESPQEVNSWIDDRIKSDVDYIKIIYEPWKNTLDLPTIKALINAAHSHDKLAVVHISDLKNANEVFKLEADGLVHIWKDKTATEAELQKMSSRPFFIIPTILTNIEMMKTIGKYTPEDIIARTEKLKNEVKKAFDVGIPIIAGTDPPNGNINMGTDLYKELIYFSEAGIPSIEVLKSATSMPAKYFKIDSIGKIKKGFKADMLLLSQNPLENMQHIDSIEAIWKEGNAIKI